jgi:hypothetical protein
MKNNLEEFRGALIDLCKKVLQGDLSIETFFTTWPKEISQTEFVSDLFDDLEECVEHFPAHVISGKKDFKLWSHSYMAYKLSVDTQLLESGLSEERMLSLRKTILDNDIKDRECIMKLIKEQSSKGSMGSEIQ